MFKTLNNNNEEVNILHFQGKSLLELHKVVRLVKYEAFLNPIPDVSIVSIWTDDTKCILKRQLQKYNIELINALPNNYNGNWYMPNKIRYYVNCLKQLDTPIVLLLDGYDVLFSSTDNLINKFMSSGYKILFNIGYSNFPKETIDIIPGREQLGFFKYFNAGCCIGYREDLLRFYQECEEYIDTIGGQSEQRIIRYAFSKYSEDIDQKFIWLDTDRTIFHTMSGTVSTCDRNTRTLNIDFNYRSNKVFKLRQELNI